MIDRKMLIYHRTSIFDSPAQTVVNTVNCVGVMGKGIAARFREQYPEMFLAYRDICARKLLQPGMLWLWKAHDRWILNFPTKRHWRHPSKLEWIDAGLKKFVAEYERRGITDVSFPRLGCGNGGLNWDAVRPIMEAHLAPLPITIYVHDYEVDVGLPEHVESGTRSAVATSRVDRSFEDFIEALHDVVDARAGQFRTMLSSDGFTVQFAPEHQLHIEGGHKAAHIDVDDLRSLWVKLLNGIVTEQTVDWGPDVRSDYILSLLGALPDVRTVQVQRRDSQRPELAVELLHRRGIQLVGESDAKQSELAWG
jgi:O-acetyl-ADP-ribose deacetylase (regulator of RNase III)